jgi:hypothetical protein
MGKLKVIFWNCVDRLKRLVHRGSTKVSDWTQPVQDKVPPQSRADYPYPRNDDRPPYNLS